MLENVLSDPPCFEHYRDYIHISDAVEGLKRLTFVNESGVVNLAGGKAIQLKQFVKLFWKELGANPNRLLFRGHEQPLYEQSQPKAYSDQTKIKSLTGWAPNLSISDGIRLTVEQLRINAESKN